MIYCNLTLFHSKAVVIQHLFLHTLLSHCQRGDISVVLSVVVFFIHSLPCSRGGLGWRTCGCPRPSYTDRSSNRTVPQFCKEKKIHVLLRNILVAKRYRDIDLFEYYAVLVTLFLR